MASDQGQYGASGGGESGMLRFFLPGLVVGTVLGSMLGLYVGTRSGSATLMDIKPSGGPKTTETARDDDRSATPAEPAAEEKPAETPAEKPPEPAGESPKPATP